MKRPLAILVAALCCAPAAAAAYKQIKTKDGLDVQWPTMPVKFKIQSSGPPGVTASSARAAIIAAYKSWSRPDCSYFLYQDLGSTTQSSGNYNDNVNTHVFPTKWNVASSKNALAVTRVFWEEDTGAMTDADILYNPAYKWSTTGAPGAYDLQSVATHEIGHQLGLTHSSHKAATMYYATGKGNTAVRSLHSDDIAGLCQMYSNGKPVSPECTEASHCSINEVCQAKICVTGSAVKKGYGAPCTGNSECSSGFCVETGSGGFCSASCEAKACPNNDQCVALKGGGKACLPGSGVQGTLTFGEACDSNSECKSKICAVIPGGRLCSRACTPGKAGDCPAGHICSASGGQSICLPGARKKHLGAACSRNSDCASDLCASGGWGLRCARFCDAPPATTCPAGFSCWKLLNSTRKACLRQVLEPFGAVCTGNGDCTSDLCATDGQGKKFCTFFCDPRKGCPKGHTCSPAGGQRHVCGPNGAPPTLDEDDDGGCGVAPGVRLGTPAWLLLLLAALVGLRRRA